ncbi:hypothetical protein BGZ94_006327 [Podila epigama]|nr:hypothetical protein BGZ94_006327 [Podila epigama]
MCTHWVADSFLAKRDWSSEALGLQPFSIKDSSGVEQIALTHSSVMQRLPSRDAAISPVVSRKRKLGALQSCSSCSPEPASGLEHYVELNEDICEVLNRDWQFSPRMRFSCATILAGCVLINGKNGEAVIANTVEVYGRQTTVDLHREPIGTIKGQPVTTSLPPSINKPYRKVWPCTVQAIDGKRLVIGTKSFDALITSSLRLDSKLEPCLGASTPTFVLEDKSSSLATKILLDKESLQAGLKMAKDATTCSISSSDLLYQLRQLKTKFFDASTFYLCRASSFFAENQPSTRLSL